MIRDTLSSLLAGPAARAVESPVREMVEEILASRSFAAPADVEALRRELEALGAGGEAAARIEALEQEIASLKKKLSMAMGALQAATAQIADAKRAAEEALGAAQKANQQATSALATAESAAQGAKDLAATASPPATKGKKAAPAAPEEAAASDACAVPGCTNKVRARGYCAKHYQQWKRGTLEA